MAFVLPQNIPPSTGGLLGGTAMPVVFNERSQGLLADVNPMLAELMRRTEEEASRRGIDFEISEGQRSRERQAQLVAQGASQTMNSRHLLGNAVDIAIQDGSGGVDWNFDSYRPIADIARAQAAELGIDDFVWGGDWRTLRDGVHFQVGGPATSTHPPHPPAPATQTASAAPLQDRIGTQNMPQGLLSGPQRSSRPSIWDSLEGVPGLGALADPDRRDRLSVALTGMTMNPNQGLISTVQRDMDARREDEQRQRMAAWLASQPGGQQYAEALAAGASQDAIVGAHFANQQAPERDIREINNQLVEVLPDGTTRPLGDYRTQEAPGAQTRIVTGDEAAALGLDPNMRYNVEEGPNGIEARPINDGGPMVAIENNMAPGETAFEESTGKLMAEQAAAIVSQGDQAQRSLIMVNELDNLLEQTPTGTGAAITAFAAEWGVELDGTDDVLALQALISRMVPEQRAPGSGPMSDADLALFQQSLPRLINTPGGNRQIAATIRSIAEYDIQRGQIASQLQMGQIDQATARQMYNELANPIDRDAIADAASAGSTQETPTAGGQDFTSATVEDLVAMDRSGFSVADYNAWIARMNELRGQ